MDGSYHEGELRAQELAGERDEALQNAGMVAGHIIPPLFRFVSQQRYFVLGFANAEHECEGTVLFGAPGFLSPQEDGRQLAVALDRKRDRQSDPVLAALEVGSRVGGLAIELSTRRRLRINGRVISLDVDQLVLEVGEVYPNCPKYIQKREVVLAEAVASAAPADGTTGTELGEAQHAIVRGADTLFVVTVHPLGHADASHRGGPPGFVKVADDGALWIPDYAGNSMFNTLGNVLTNPSAALVFWDFERNRLLHLSGTATLHFGREDPEGMTGGTGRFWSFRVRRFRGQPVDVPFRMRWVAASPFNPSRAAAFG